jgi:CheY-like chemotaxis protein
LSREPYSGNWISALAEAAEVAGATELGTATSTQLRRAWDMVAETAGVSLSDLAGRLAKQARLSVADLTSIEPHATHVVPAELARRRLVMPLRCTGKDVTVAMANPLSQEVKREVATLSGRTVHIEVAPPADLASTILEAYGEPSGNAVVAPPRPEVTKSGGPRVLVVDDEAGSRALFRAVLEGGGFGVTLAKDGNEALAILRDKSGFDLVTLDYFMDGMNGLRVLQQVRSQAAYDELPVIMVTGASDRRIEMSLFEAGADDFIVKPIDAPLFLLRIHAVLRRRQHR